jgi:branched-chain amino acid transport system permease protein
VRAAVLYGAVPVAIAALAAFAVPAGAPLVWQALVSCALVTALGPLLYRVAFEAIAGASSLVLLVAAIAVHLGLVGMGLFFFGPEGVRTPALGDGSFAIGAMMVSAQSLWVLAVSAGLIVALFVFFGFSFHGKALLAAAYHRRGARLVGIGVAFTGRLTFALAAAIGALSGVLIAPITTIYYDSGFLLALKGFVGAIIGGLAAYPAAALGAVLVGMLEAFASFWASAYKEVIVFTLIVPVLLWRSFVQIHPGAHAEEDA